MRSIVATLAIASAVSTSCIGMKSPFRKPPPATIALGGSGFAILSTGMFLLVAGRKACLDVERVDGVDQDCTADDTYNVLAVDFMAVGFAATVIAGLMFARSE